MTARRRALAPRPRAASGALPRAALAVAWCGFGACVDPVAPQPLASAASEPPASEAGAVSGAPVLRVLGTAQDGGLPHAGCACDSCSAALVDPARARRVSSLAVVAGGRAWLIDATPDLREQLRLLRPARGVPGVDRRPVEGVFLTHAHLGHYTGLAFFGYEAIHTRELPVWGTPSMAAFLRANAPWSRLVEIGNIRLHELPPGAGVELDAGVSVTALGVPHRDELSDTVGFLIRGPRTRVLYVPDTDSWNAWDPPLVARLSGVDVAILDGTFFAADELPGRDVSEIGHPLMRESMELLEPLVSAGRLAVYFTHLNHSNPALDPHGPQRRAIESRGFRVLAEDQRIPL
jgi:pyrroloquinoline quinone biosynthesis protein B